MTPTTHILKTQLGVLPNGINPPGSVENEFFCRAMGADVAEVEIVDFEDVRSLVVTRFDRRWTADGRLIRLPQEGSCQALFVPPSQEYQQDGRPGIAEGIGLLAGSDKPEADQRSRAASFLTSNQSGRVWCGPGEECIGRSSSAIGEWPF